MQLYPTLLHPPLPLPPFSVTVCYAPGIHCYEITISENAPELINQAKTIE